MAKGDYHKRSAAGQLPLLTPGSAWRTPTELPDWRRAGRIGADTETKDDGLAQGRGPGWVYGAGHLCGISMATAGQAPVYAPVRHPDSDCLDLDKVRRWWIAHATAPDLEIVFQNAQYDVGWLWREFDAPIPPKIHDSSFMAVMLDEHQLSYSLDSILLRLGLPGKDETLLREAAAAYGVDPKAGLWRLPARYVGPYAEQDAAGALSAAGALLPLLEAEEQLEAYQLEIDLIPLMVEMRRRGVKVNVDRALVTKDLLLRRRDEILADLSRRLSIGRAVTIRDVASDKFLERVFEAEGVPFPRTSKTQQGSFKTDWMEKRDHWLPQLVCRAAQMQDAGNKFVGNYILGFSHRGRLHADTHQLRGGGKNDDDNKGTRTSRFSYSNPPLQQMTSPDKHEEVGFLIRDLFEPEDGEIWGAADYSQQEPALSVHFASLCGVAGAAKAVDYYHNAPKPDYHTMVAQMTGLPRPKAKIINLGLSYGMGKYKLAAQLGVSLEEADRILKQYHDEVPFVRRLSEYAGGLASKRGWLRLLDGARVHFERWEPRWRDRDGEAQFLALHPGSESELIPCSLSEAQRRASDADHPWHGAWLKRAFTHKAMNALVQGSAARQTKLAMRECWREGLIPLLQMHDELDFSHSSEREALRASEIMRDVAKLMVPVRVDGEYGVTWGKARKSDGYGATWAEAEQQMRMAA